MIKIYYSNEDKIVETSDITKGQWINMVKPTINEMEYISKQYSVDIDFIKSALDEEERSRIEKEDDSENLLVLVDTPYISKKVEPSIYSTIPIGIIYTKDAIITVSLKETLVLDAFLKGRVKTFYTFKKTRFILQILYKNASLYLYFLKKIDKQSSMIENELHKSMKNKELIEMLSLEKGLVYFSTSLKANEIVIEKLLRYPVMKKYEEDIELLEDIIIENKQAIEMAKIYSDILSGMMDAFASIISNNLNIVMKKLTSITILMAVPTIIASFFGMNVIVPLSKNPYGFLIVLGSSSILCVIIAIIMYKKDMF